MSKDIGPMSIDDYISISGEAPAVSMRGLSCIEDGNCLGIAGVMHTVPLTAFSMLTDRLSTDKRTIVKAVRKYRDLLNSYDSSIYAVPNKLLTTAPGFLSHVGFRKLHDGVYVWH
jgi:hypothetical protein